MRSAWAVALAICVGACATYRQDLNRAQGLYEENEYERALAIFRSLQRDTDSLSFTDRARYAYLRGMTDYRLGFRSDARHWLAIAKATEQQHPGGLSSAWKERLEGALTDLNGDVYGGAFAKARASAPATDGGPGAAGPVAPATESAAPEAACDQPADCPAGQVCQDAVCVTPR